MNKVEALQKAKDLLIEAGFDYRTDVYQALCKEMDFQLKFEKTPKKFKVLGEIKPSEPKVIGHIDLSKFDKKISSVQKEESFCGNCGSVLHTSECVCDALNLW